MKVTIESTSKIVNLDGVPARIWEGKTESGIEIFCFVTRIGVEIDVDPSEFERELISCRKPSPNVAHLPLSLAL